MDVLDHVCPGCGAKLPFNPETQRWDCPFCGGSYALEDLGEEQQKQENAKVENRTETNLEEDFCADMYSCPNCGAQILADENTTATFCVYCGSTSIIKERLVNALRPSKIIPFKNTKEDARKAFVAFKKGKIFAPSDFSELKNIEKISGVYIPFWVYDASTSGDVIYDAQRIKTWRSGDYRYTQTDEYLVARSGNMDFAKVPVDGSTKFDDDTMDSIEPFNYDGLVDFNMSYLSGFLAEKYDVDSQAAYKRAYTRMENSVEQELKNTCSGYNTMVLRSKTIDIDETKADYILLPVWMLNINHNGQMYTFAMNGQTGKMVGNIPIDKKKRLLYTSGVFLLTLIITSILGFLFTL